MDNRWCKVKRNIYKKRYSLCSVGIGLIFFLILWGLTALFKRSLCIVKNIFGVRCFGCGLTRGFIAIIKLDFHTATSYNVLSLPIFIGIVLYVLLLVIDILFHKKTVEKLEVFMKKKFMILVYIMMLIFSTILNNR